MGSCRAAWTLLATVWALTPQSPPEMKWMASVALAGTVRTRYVGDRVPMRNWQSVPGVRPVPSCDRAAGLANEIRMKVVGLQLGRLLRAAGFGDVEGYSSPAQEPFRLGCHGLLLVADTRGN